MIYPLSPGATLTPLTLFAACIAVAFGLLLVAMWRSAPAEAK